MTILKHANRAFSMLASGITDIALSLSVTPTEGAKFPALGTFNVTIFKPATPDTGREIVTVSARTGDVFTITRGAEGTTPVAHDAGDYVWLNVTSGLINGLETEIGLKMATADDAAAAVSAMGVKGDANPLNHDKYVHPNHSGDVTSVADGAQTLVATAGVNAIALAAAVKAGAIEDSTLQAPTHDAVFDALALKAPSTNIALSALAAQAAYTFLANLTSGSASPTAATAIQAFMLMMRACAAADHGNLGATHTFDLSTNWVHTGTVDQAVAITPTDPGVSGIVCRLILTATAGSEAISFVAGSHLDHAANWAAQDMPTAMPTGAGSRMEIFLQRTQDADYYIASYITAGAKT